MTMPPTSFDDTPSDLNCESSTATAELEPIETDDPVDGEWTGPICEKCAAPLKSDVVTVCRQCGWYPSLGQFVEIDQDWEVDYEAGEQPVGKPRPSHLEVWLNLLPWWAWLLIATVVVVVGESIAVRLLQPEVGGLRTTWSITQLGIGLVALFVCHIFNFIVAVVEDAEVGAFDLVLKPLKLWFRAAKNLPARLWVTDVALGGLTGVMMSLFVIGALPYEKLWDWGIEKPPEQNLVAAIASRVQQLESRGGADNLEDAVGDLAGSQDLEPVESKPTPPPKPREKVDCLILGYRLDAQGRLNSILLATAYKRKLAYAGYVTPDMSDEDLANLTERLVAAKTHRPFLTLHTSGNWVEPKLSCRVSYTKRSDTGRLLDAQWEELLGEIVPNQ
jgi:hypothetical protein